MLLFVSMKAYGAPFRHKYITFMHTNFNFCTTSKYFLCDKTFQSIRHILVCNSNCFLSTCIPFLCNTNIFSQRESLFWFFLLPQHIFCVTHIILVPNVISLWIFFLDATKLVVQHVKIFCATCTEYEHKEYRD